MRGIARIAYDGGMLMLPSRTPYDVEVVVGALDWYAHQFAKIRLQLDDGNWLVSAAGNNNAVCGSCHTQRAALVFSNGTQTMLCPRCTQQTVGGRTPR